jgi:hypothetical protein
MNAKISSRFYALQSSIWCLSGDIPEGADRPNSHATLKSFYQPPNMDELFDARRSIDGEIEVIKSVHSAIPHQIVSNSEHSII